MSFLNLNSGIIWLLYAEYMTAVRLMIVKNRDIFILFYFRYGVVL